MVTNILHYVFQTQPCLRGGGDDLIGWQEESVASGVPQLEGKGIFDANVIGPVDAATTGRVWEERK